MEKQKKSFMGRVVSAKMAGVVVVEVERLSMHPKYKKSIKKTKRYHVGNQIGAKVGDVLEFVETRPLSRSVKWNGLRVVNRVEEKKVTKTKSRRKVS